MKKVLIILMLFCLLFEVCACVETDEPQKPVEGLPSADEEPNKPKEAREEQEAQSKPLVYVFGRTFTADEINEGVKSTIQCNLYYYGESHDSAWNTDLFVGREVEYDLFLEHSKTSASETNRPDSFQGWVNQSLIDPPIVYFVGTNMLHPQSNETDPRLYWYGINLTKWGVQSYINSGYSCEVGVLSSYHVNKDMIYLGHYKMTIDEITKPIYEEKSEEWKEMVKNAIRRQMDANDLNENAENNLPVGKYHVYTRNTQKSDRDTIIVFEHEDGRYFVGNYYFVQEIGLGGTLMDCEQKDGGIDIGSYKRFRLDPGVELDYEIMKKE